MAVLKILGTVIGRVVQLVLPFFLLPSDFGIVALVLFFSGMLTITAEMGLTTDLVRRKQRFKEAAATAFTLRLGLSVGMIAVSPLLGLAMSIAYGEGRLFLPFVISSFGLAIQTLAMVPRVTATRNLDFRRASIPDNAGKYTGGLSTVALAVVGFAYWGPVIGALLGLTVGSLLQLRMSHWRPKLELQPALARELVRFGMFVTLSTFSTFFARSVDNAIVGFLLGVAPLGFYAYAYSWSVYLTSSLSSVLSVVSYPVLSRVADMPTRLRRALEENLKYYGYAAFGLGAGVIVFAPTLIRVLYGATWAPAIVPMQVLAITGLLTGFAAIGQDALWALGRSRTVFLITATEAVAITVLVPPATLLGGIVGTSVATVPAAALVAWLMSAASHRETGLPWKAWTGSAVRPGFSAFVAALMGIAFLSLGGATMITLIVGAAIFLGTYFGVLYLVTGGRVLSEVRQIARMLVR